MFTTYKTPKPITQFIYQTFIASYKMILHSSQAHQKHLSSQFIAARCRKVLTMWKRSKAYRSCTRMRFSYYPQSGGIYPKLMSEGDALQTMPFFLCASCRRNLCKKISERWLAIQEKWGSNTSRNVTYRKLQSSAPSYSNDYCVQKSGERMLIRRHTATNFTWHQLLTEKKLKLHISPLGTERLSVNDLGHFRNDLNIAFEINVFVKPE